MSKEDKWKAKLSPHQYNILRQKGTEPPFSGSLLNCKDAGTYHCAACSKQLFSSADKYDSGSGWPSFTASLESSVDYVTDKSLLRVRTEVICTECKSHLGHVFDDGPQPTGKRYCINSLALTFQNKD